MAIPSTPANLALTVTASNLIEVAWDNVADEDGFYLYRSEDDVTYLKIATLDADVVSYDDYVLEVDTAYYYKISAFNGDGESALSSEQHATTLAESAKTVYFHSLGPFEYDENSVYPEEKSKFKKAIYGGGKSWLNYLHVDSDLRVDNSILFGPDATEGTWRIVIITNDITFQRYETGSWVTKGSFAA